MPLLTVCCWSVGTCSRVSSVAVSWQNVPSADTTSPELCMLSKYDVNSSTPFYYRDHQCLSRVCNDNHICFTITRHHKYFNSWRKTEGDPAPCKGIENAIVHMMILCYHHTNCAATLFDGVSMVCALQREFYAPHRYQSIPTRPSPKQETSVTPYNYTHTMGLLCHSQVSYGSEASYWKVRLPGAVSADYRGGIGHSCHL